jgi:alkanesulfonate monooxygenase SsuD/methylene tetrahydromethanopterin reductase-like flavin-dependent oxidoreductase (luciferase family)
VINPFTRGPGVLAQSAAAVQEASQGRFVLGLGASSNVIVERFNELRFERPLAKMRWAIDSLRPVLSVPAERGIGGLRLERPVTHPVPIVLAALRPRMLALAAELADGAFTNFLPLSGLEQVVTALRAGEQEAAVEEGSTELVCRFFLLPMPEAEAINLARLMFAAYGSVPVYANFFRWLGWAEQLDPMVEAYESGDRQRAAELAPVELMREIFLFGSPEQIKQRLEQFVAGGITTCVLTLMAPPDQIPGLIDALAR